MDTLDEIYKLYKHYHEYQKIENGNPNELICLNHLLHEKKWYLKSFEEKQDIRQHFKIKLTRIAGSRREWMLDLFKKAIENHNRNKNYQFWQYGNHAEEIYTLHFMWDKLNYIHLNPIRAGIVEKAQYYIYSSASNYVTGKGLLRVELAENPIIDVTKKNEFWKYNNYDE